LNASVTNVFVIRRALEAAGDEFIDGEYGVLGNHDTIQMAPSLEAIDTATPDPDRLAGFPLGTKRHARQTGAVRAPRLLQVQAQTRLSCDVLTAVPKPPACSLTRMVVVQVYACINPQKKSLKNSNQW